MTQIAYLADNAQVIPRLADWYRSEWGPYYGDHGPGDALFDLKSRCNHDRIPIGLVAMKGQQVQGTVALGLDEATSLEPSVIGLLVRPEYRRQGVGMLLIESAESLAKQLGFDRIFLSTMVLDNLLRRLDWIAAWCYLAIVTANFAINYVYLRKHNPELIEHRMRFQKGTKWWDKL